MSGSDVPPPQQIRDARTAAGLTQRQLAERVGIRQSRIADYEAGRVEPAASKFLAILKACKRK